MGKRETRLMPPVSQENAPRDLPMIDTPQTVKRLIEAGASEQMAEVIADAVKRSEGDLVTKDFLAAGLAKTREELRKDVRRAVAFGVLLLSLLMALFRFL